MKELSKIYQAENYEDAIYKKWEESGFFKPQGKGKPFSLVLPPPNVTGKLHIGHAAMLAYQDVLARYHRLQGDKTLWLPGMDHAAIATQNVVEKELKKAGHSRYDLGRTRFLNKVEVFAEDSKKVIRAQIKKMGSSLDWSRERFTLDESSSLAVKTAFKKMYDDGLIYRGERVVNWCPRCQSTLADDEVEHREEQSKLYFIKYGHVTVATTRPETKLGDTGVAVNPKDERYKKLVGEKLVTDLMGNFLVLKVFADRAVDMSFGTGAIGVTPAHSQTDYQWALKHDLSFIKVINEEGKMTAAAGQYQGLTVKECREKLVADLQHEGKIEKIEEYTNNLSVCYRCGTAIEPLTSKQWFVAVDKKIPSRGKTLKQLAIDAVKKGGVKIIPDRFNKTYFQWMDNLRDWCISRQIWYGHRIPVWYKGDQNYVGLTAPTGEGWLQDEDTLDTWFSSSLWTFSTLGWPAKTPDLKTFHPTSVMETGYDILFFWVARMILMSTYLIKEVPFKTVYLHGLVRDKEGRKMSKSLGNGIDPLDMIAKFGADALRLSLLVGATPGNDVRLYEEKIAGYRNFVNKLWNISRYILSKSQDANHKIQKNSLSSGAQRAEGDKSQISKQKTLADKWILSELNKIIVSTAKNIEEFKFSAAGEELYEFTWSKLADWYLEAAKLEGGKDKILLLILEKLLILWHPFCPFVTEAIWSEMGKKSLLMIERWPKATVKKQSASRDFDLLKETVMAVRNIRSQRQISPKEILDCSIKTSVKAVKDNLSLLAGLAGLKIAASVKGIKVNSAKVEIILAIQANAELDKRRAAEAMQLRQYIEVQQKKLSNQSFVSRAPQQVIAKEKEKLKEAEEKLKKLE